MIEKVIIPKEYKNRFLKKKSFEFDKRRAILLYGCNGIGKSSLLNLIANNSKRSVYKEVKIFEDYNKYIKHSFDKEIPKIVYWKASKDTVLRNQHNDYVMGSIERFSLFASQLEESEGEAVGHQFLNFLDNLEDDIDLLLIDELDSGLGIINIQICFYYLNEWLKKHPKAQMIMSINNYHFVYHIKKVYRMDTGKTQEINNYEEFFELSKEIHEKKYKLKK